MPGVNVLVSIHAAQAGCDNMSASTAQISAQFQFTQPKRAATWILLFLSLRRWVFQFTQPKRAATCTHALPTEFLLVSIHAAQAGCDHRSRASHKAPRSFNSRSPSGLRPTARASGGQKPSFNSRSPSGLRRLLQRYNKKEILSKDKSRKSLLVIIIDVEDKAIELELTDNQTLRNSNKIMFT